MKKLFYTIGEVSNITGVEPHVLRYWESLFRELSPGKNRAGKRIYRDSDIEIIRKLKSLIQDKKYSTAGARRVLREEKTASSEIRSESRLPDDLIQDLSRVRDFLSDLRNKI